MYTGEVKSESEMLEPGTQGIAVICAEAQRPMFDWRRYTFHTTQPKSCAYVRTKPAENVAYVFPDVQAFFPSCSIHWECSEFGYNVKFPSPVIMARLRSRHSVVTMSYRTMTSYFEAISEHFRLFQGTVEPSLNIQQETFVFPKTRKLRMTETLR